MKPPPFTAVFNAQFPGWGRDEKPVRHPITEWSEEKRDYVETGEERVCDMPFHSANGTCMSIRYSHCGPVGIDRRGGVWLLVHDYAIAGRPVPQWIRYPGQVAK